MTQPYYSDESCTLYHGDCLDILPQLERWSWRHCAGDRKPVCRHDYHDPKDCGVCGWCRNRLPAPEDAEVPPHAP